MLSVVFALVLALQSSAAQQRNDTRTWYQAYADAQRDIQLRNWQVAITDLQAATRLGAPKPGRNVLFYGDVYRDFNPDYYLGVAYLNLNRYAEAGQAFDRVRQAQLIVARDNLYPEFTRQAGMAKDVLDKQAATSQRPSTTASNAPAAPVTSSAAAQSTGPIGGVQTSAQQAPVQSAAVQQTVQQAPVQQAPIQQAAVQQPAQTQPAPSQRTPGKAPSSSPPRPVNAARPNSAPAIAPRQPIPAPVAAAALGDERPALVDFFSGQYAAARAKLDALVATGYASPRAHFYLACSRVALSLTGQAGADDTIAAAQAELALAGDAGRFAADAQIISPRITQALGLRP